MTAVAENVKERPRLRAAALPEPTFEHEALPLRWARKVPWGLLVLLGVMALVGWDRWRVLTNFSFKYTDHDQVLMWYAADEAAHGRFHEPNFYGQDYSLAVDAWAAVPLLWMGVSHPVALPVAACGLTMLPYVLLAGLAWAARRPWAGVLVMLVPLVMPIEYGIVSSMPRCFVGGIALAGVAAGLWMFCRNKWAYLAAGGLSIIALTANPNCSILLLAAGAYGLLRNWKRWRFYVWSLAGMILAVPIPLSVWRFYHVWHPSYDFHPPLSRRIPLDFAWLDATQSLRNLDTFFSYFVPWNSGIAAWAGNWHIGSYHGHWVLLGGLFAVLLVALVSLWEWRGGVALAATLAFVFISLGVNKVHDIRTHIWYPGARMYLAVPVLLAMSLLWLDIGLERWRKRGFVAAGIRAVLILGALWLLQAKDLKLLNPPASLFRNAEPIQVSTVEEIQRTTEVIRKTAEAQHAKVVLLTGQNDGVYAYAVPPLTGFAVETLLPRYERRTWRLEEEAQEHRGKILVFTTSGTTPRGLPPSVGRVFIVNSKPVITCIESSKTLTEIMKSMGVYTPLRGDAPAAARRAADRAGNGGILDLFR